ncbi:MAG: 4Fe-4S dicluster domain-containing protein [Candidatus Omnitrophota bacterium]
MIFGSEVDQNKAVKNAKRLFIDLEKCAGCRECVVACDYFYHPQNNGIASLREYATFATICRHCEEAPCVNSCYHSALERSPEGHIKRAKMRCTSCKACSVACPFGIIFQNFIPYLDSKCDYCVARVDTGISVTLPACVTSCPEKAIEIREVKDDPAANIYCVGDNLAVHTLRWMREDIVPRKDGIKK